MRDDLEIIHATQADLEDAAALFDAYRVWYGSRSDLDGARNFLAQRLRHGESELFMARVGVEAVGFAQLYPVFSSVSMGPVWILNDLYVVESCRRTGVGTVLLEAAAEFGRQTGAIRLELATGVDNRAAQQAYAAHGWVKNEDFLHYSLPLT